MEKRPEKLNQILQAATKEFLEKGVDGATMDRITEISSVSKRTLYKYFPSKVDIYNALIDNVLDQVEGMYAFEFDPQKSLKEQISKVVDLKISSSLDDTFVQVSRIIIGEMLKGRRPSPNQMERLYTSENQFLNWVKDGQANNMITKDNSAEDIAYQFHAILKGRSYWPVLTGGVELNDDEVFKIKSMTIKFFLNSFKE